MRAVLHIARKDLRLLARRRADAFFVFAFPALFAVFFTQIVSGGAPSRLAVAVVDEDGGPRARALASRLLADAGLSAVALDRAAAEAAVRRGRRAAYVLLPAGLDRGEKVVLAVDPTRQGEAGLLRGVVLQLVAAPPAWAGLAPPLELRDVRGAAVRPPTPAAITLPQGLAWALIACAAAFGSSLAAERTRGTLVRMRAASLGPAQVLAAKGLACFVTVHIVSALLLALAVVAFDLRPGRWDLLALAIASAAACFVGLMMLVASLGRTEEAANRAGWAVLLVLAMLGGAMVPSHVVPEWLERAGHVSPVRWAILAFEGAIWRGFDAQDLLAPCAVLVGVGAASFALGAAVFRWR